ncbi:lamin tail domain-containing protein [Curtobacterium herbarum]|uniref:LTD domain-containing protein n=1 Tax=Curtobacterium herbarum TaxID=150122 RepID=A0ABP4K759_9MICO|nr:lamin tail domain-containing protein [Curtobacterium herbarum]MBM7474147.1 hypothetical protein [Curtobacterium herbarum]
MRPTALRLGASIATGLVVAAGVLAVTPASAAPTPTAAPTTPAASAAPAANGIVINEVESNGDDTDWVELRNTATVAADVSGWSMLDDSDEHTRYVLPAGSVVAPGGYLVVDEKSTTTDGFGFGLGSPDEVRFFDTTAAPVLSYAYEAHADVTYGRCPDGTGPLVDTTSSTKSAANDCSSPIRINEVESKDGTPGDWVELTNTGTTAVDLGGYVFQDDDDTHAYAIPAGTTIAPGGFTVLDEADFGFGLGGADSARLSTPAGVLVDATSWTKHADVTYGRNPDGTGDFAQTSAATKGTANTFAGVVTAEPWPGGPDERVLDDADTFSGDLSGLDWQSSRTAVGGGVLWGVQNGDGLLYRMASDGAGGWAPSNATGTTLHYADGSGTPDAEGVTVTADDPGAVYVSTERDDEMSSTSRPAVLRFATDDGSERTLNATDEWNLAGDFPGLGANAGLEGVTWVPDSWLTEQGFVDESTGAAYSPTRYSGHGDGLFFVGVEGTASVYAYALMDDGSSKRIATIATPFAVVAEVQFDPTLDALWVVCDDACAGRTALFDVQDGAFTAATVYDAPSGAARDLANEGFAISDVCTDGERATFYADDNDTDGSSLRTGTFPCTEDTAPTPTPGGGDGGGAPTPTTPAPSPNPSAPSPSTPSPSVPTPGAPDQSSLTSANRGGISAPASARAGQTITVTMGRGHAGERVAVFLYSAPVLIGTPVVAADGSVQVTIPADTTAGAHRIAVVGADGVLIGWSPITITTAGTGQLAFTGAELASGSAAALLLLALGAGLLVARRRRRTAE